MTDSFLQSFSFDLFSWSILFDFSSYYNILRILYMVGGFIGCKVCEFVFSHFPDTPVPVYPWAFAETENSQNLIEFFNFQLKF